LEARRHPLPRSTFHLSHLRIWTGACEPGTGAIDDLERGGFHMLGFHGVTPEPDVRFRPQKQSCYQGLRALGLTLSGNITASIGEVPTRIGGWGSCSPYGTVLWVSEPPIVVALDPGHGSTCEVNGMLIGTVGLTNFQSPPFGYLYENDLTVEFARETQRVLPTTKYKVVLTKNDVHSCPSYVDRGRVANNENARAFISIHVNAPNKYGPSFPLGNGTSTLYHPQRPEAQTLAIELADRVSSSLGVNNRGALPSDKHAVLKPTVTDMPAVILETARVSGTDEVALHAHGASTRVANGIRQALDNYFRK